MRIYRGDCVGIDSNLILFFSFLFREAESFKEQGNAYYAKKDYNEAYNYYTKAIGEKDLVLMLENNLPNTVTNSSSLRSSLLLVD